MGAARSYLIAPGPRRRRALGPTVLLAGLMSMGACGGRVAEPPVAPAVSSPVVSSPAVSSPAVSSDKEERAQPRSEKAAILVSVGPVRLERPTRLAPMARLLESLGAPSARPSCEHLEWGRMQPQPGAAIDFRVLDGFVAAFQAAGFTDFLICLGSRSPWASSSSPGALHSKNPVPRPEHMDAYGQWFGAVVERYDADGVDDMPGLRHPLRYYEVGSELPTREAEAPASYLVMLEHAHRAAHAAMPDVVVTPAAVVVTNAFRDAPGPDGYATALASLSERVAPRGGANLQILLDRSDLFDAVNLADLGDPLELEAALDWLRYEMRRRGYRRPVVISSASPNPLIAWGAATRCDAPSHEVGLVIFPAEESDRCRLAAYFGALLAGDPQAVAWTREFAASELVKKVVIAAERNVHLISVSFIEDLVAWQLPDFKAGAGAAAWAGLVDVDRGETRPGYRALQRLLERLRGRDSVRRVPMPRPEARVYALDGSAGRLWIAWYQAREVVLPGEPPPAAPVRIPTTARRARVESLHASAAGPEPAILEAEDGVVWIEATPTPVFVVPLK